MYNRIKKLLDTLLGNKRIKGIWYTIVNNDIIMKIYLCFTFVLLLTGLLTGIIFIRLYRQNYLRSYTELLTKQGRTIAKRVSKFERNGKLEKFQRYSTYIDEIENSENINATTYDITNDKNKLRRIRYVPLSIPIVCLSIIDIIIIAPLTSSFSLL